MLQLRPGAERSAAVADVRRLFAQNRIPVDSIHVVDRIPMDPRHHSKVEYSALRHLLTEGNQIHDLAC